MTSKTIGFRVDEETAKRLHAMAAAEGRPLGELLREVVQERLDGVDTATARFEQLAAEQERFRKDFANAVEAILLLVATGEKLPRSEARQWAKDWVNKKLRRKI